MEDSRNEFLGLPAGEVAARVAFFAAVEADLIQRPDPEFRFHSGVPA